MIFWQSNMSRSSLHSQYKFMWVIIEETVEINPKSHIFIERLFWFPNRNISPWCRYLSFMLLLLTFLQGKFHGNPMHVAVVISNCLREERRILAAANMPVQVIFSELVTLSSPWTQFLWNRNSFPLPIQLLYLC